MIFGTARKVRRQRESQEAIPGLSVAIARRLDEIEQQVGSEDCRSSYQLLARADSMLQVLIGERLRAGLPGVGPFGSMAAMRMASLRSRVDMNCGGAIAYRQ
jgi:hypothetical protein